MAQHPDPAVLGRYRIPVVQRWVNVALAVGWSVIALAGRAGFFVVLAALFIALTAVGWLLPTTVLDERGVRRPLGRPGRRRIPWSDVEDVVLGKGLQNGGVYLRLRNQSLVSLNGVTPDRQLALQSALPGYRRASTR